MIPALIEGFPLYLVWALFAFVFGAAAGSFAALCAARLPYEKSVLWPGSRCDRCLQTIHWYDNLPLVSYWILRGRCRACGQTFSIGHFLVELFTAVAFAGLYYLVIVRNVTDLPALAQEQFRILWGAPPPWWAWVVFVHHALLVFFLIVASLCDLSDMEIPLSLTVTGTVVGLVCAVLLPWPFPSDLLARSVPPLARNAELGLGADGFGAPPQLGLCPWPVWYPLPAWLPAGSPQLGLLTGLAGALAGMMVLRAVRFLFGLGRGVEGLGVGDADLMMMAGSFLGWQPVVLAFFVSVFPALFLGLLQVVRGGGQAMPFGPSLALGVVLTRLFWLALGRHFAPFFFQPLVLGFLAGAGAVLLLVVSFALRLVRGPEPDPEKPQG